MNTTTQESASKVTPPPAAISSEMSSVLHSMCLARLALPDCRALEDLERKDADEFFAAHFNAERSKDEPC
jgi:hypothetical protein